MDVVEYAEKLIDSKLPEWQKAALRDAHKIYKGSSGKLYVVMRPFNGRKSFYTYLKQNNIPTCRELIQNGTTPENYR